MEKTDLLLLMMEHPHDYTDGQWEDVLADDECRELYALLAGITGTLAARDNETQLTDEDVTKEWRCIEARRPARIRTMPVARKIAAVSVGMLIVSGIALAAIMTHLFGLRPGVKSVPETTVAPASPSAPAAATDSIIRRDSIPAAQPKLYDNVPLQDILTELAAWYRVEVDYRSERARQQRLYFRWEPDDPLDKVVGMLDHFEALHLYLEDGTLIVEQQDAQP